MTLPIRAPSEGSRPLHLSRLLALRLILPAGDAVIARPALARYGVTEPTIQESL